MTSPAPLSPTNRFGDHHDWRWRLSVYGAGKLILKPDAWRLFRYVRADYIRGHEGSSKISLLIESVSGAATVDAPYREVKNNDQ
ncbi:MULTISPECIES: DUF4225 domain-containing protein [unclassified Pseudomonas]|uniref:DUF4225 domain-containing protein n=1 Tax=unclassified Pseudomonas TaxID=196821 RepID=UPI001B33B7B2|nr:MULTISPECIES: DUF4225 domain-containing protein [unclassified Pseudomonas]MBP5946897.1 DUF4225 domain-containing protein [Pseudomonas sp. P9(2020)]MBZ9565035.1 DUF4225 domain-containing protein [Pseudomonas sp. P116]